MSDRLEIEQILREEEDRAEAARAELGQAVRAKCMEGRREKLTRDAYAAHVERWWSERPKGKRVTNCEIAGLVRGLRRLEGE